MLLVLLQRICRNRRRCGQSNKTSSGLVGCDSGGTLLAMYKKECVIHNDDKMIANQALFFDTDKSIP